MKEWWDNLTLLGQVFCTIAIPATVIMVIQSIMMFLGLGFDMDAEVSELDGSMDTSGLNDLVADSSDGLSLFTIRGLVAFFAVGGWSGLVVLKGSGSEGLSVIVALLAGFAALLVIALLFKYAMKLQSNGTMSINNAVGKSAEVYIPIPGNRRGTGKVMVNVQEQLRELSAVTEEPKDLKTGEMVQVAKVLDEQTVVVVSHKSDSTIESIGGISKWVQK